MSFIMLVSCGEGGGQKEAGPIKIGYIGPLTGDAASIGADTVNGTRFAVDEINETGGINGRQVSLIAEDGRCTGADAASAAQKFIHIDQVDAIMGGMCSSETLGASPITESAAVIMISPISSSPDITHAGDFIFRTYPSDSLKGMALTNYFASKGYKRIAIISENTDFCIGVRDSIEQNLKEGMELIFDETVDPGTKDYRSLMTRLKDEAFDVFLVNGQSPVTVAAMVEQMRELGIEQPIVGTDTSDSEILGQLASDAVEGLRALSVPSLSATDPKSGPFATAFIKKYGEPQFGLFFTALSYESTKLLLETIGSVGTDGAAIRDALYAHPGYNSIIGTISFDEQGDVRGIPFALKEFQGGKLIEVERIPLN